MASTKQRKKQQVKEAIASLCHILNSIDSITRITPENFRQAKFDQADVIPSMWTLLNELLQLNSKYADKSEVGFERADVQSSLYQMGYRCAGFYGNSDVGSRDILLATGWLLAKLDFVNEQVKVKLAESSPPISNFQLGAFQKLSSGIESASKQLNNSVSSPSNPVGQAKYLVWLMGRLKLALKALYCEQQGLCAAMHHVHEATQGVGMLHPSHVNHLSAWQTFILRHPKQLQQYLVHLEKQSTLLQACMTWTEVEPIFWQWMDSVHEAKLSSGEENPIPSISSSPHPPANMIAPKRISQRLQQLHDLEAAFTRQLQDLEDGMEFRGVKDLLNQLSDHPDIHKRKADINNAVKARITNGFEEHKKMDSRRYPIQTVQFSFKPEQTKHRRLKAEPVPSNTLNIKDEIDRMLDSVRRLQEELDFVKLKQQQRLDGYAEGLMNVVCIPPMSEKTSYSGV